MQEYKARDKTVKKMSQGGLIEENLHSGETVRVSQREKEARTLSEETGDSVNFQSVRRHQDSAEPEKRKHRPRQVSDEGNHMSADLISGISGTKNTFRAEQEPEGSNEEREIPEDSGRTAEHSSRMGSIRGHPASLEQDGKDAAVSHSRKKKQVLAYAQKERKEKETKEAQKNASVEENVRFRGSEDTPEQSLESIKEDLKGKAKRERLQKEQRKKVSRLSFGDEENGMISGAGMTVAKKTASAAAASVSAYVHGKETDEENGALEGADRAEIAGETALRYAFRRSKRRMQYKSSRLPEDAERMMAGRLQFEAANEAGKTAGKHAAEAEQEKNRAVKRFWQKKQYKKAYQSARQGEKTAVETTRAAQTFLEKTKSIATSFIKTHKGIFGIAAAVVLLFVMVSAGLSSCGAMLQGSASSIVGTTYASDDEDIYAVEAAYAQLEAELNNQINSMESRHPGYDEYCYQVDEISHNPYHLISYFTALYGDFTYEQVADEVEEIFQQQYGLTTEATREVVTETKTVRVGESIGQVVTSGYCNCPICCGVWSGGPTASGAYPTANHTIAVDATNPFVPMGTHVVMNGVEYVVEDTGNFAQYGVQFDVYYGDHTAASAHGHQTWEAYIADSNGSQEVEVTTTQEVNRFDVTLSNHSLDAVLRSRMSDDEEKRYDLYNITYGNRNYLFDVDSLPSYDGGGFGYDIPAEALSDAKFANMIREAEKYLGYPYVWGGASPSTSFDCSGFVSWVINNCGNGWNVGRQTADGLRSCCAYVSPSQAKPGDLIFFQGTYDTPGASHVGIYVGDNMMIHCGNPIQYTSISSAYWQQHFLAFGRIQ